MTKDPNSDSIPKKKNFSLPRAKVLRGRKNFQRLFEHQAKTLRDTHIQLRFRTYHEEGSECLMGFIVKKKLGKAVKRNRVKRLMKEAYRKHQSILCDVVATKGIHFHGALMANNTELSLQEAEVNIEKLLSEVRNYLLTVPDH